MTRAASRKSPARANRKLLSAPRKQAKAYRVVLGLILLYSCIALLFSLYKPGDYGNAFTAAGLFRQAQRLQSLTNCVLRDAATIPISGVGRNLDRQLPPDARVFLPNMLGPENSGKGGYYFFMTYYLFPREVSISAGSPLVDSGNGFEGHSPSNKQELVQLGYNIALDFKPDGKIEASALAPMPASPPPDPATTVCKDRQALLAGLLPLLVAGLGLWLLSSLFAIETSQMSFGERFACGLGLGSVFVSQTLFGCHLVGLAPERAIFWALVAGNAALLLRHFKSIRGAFAQSVREWSHPASLLVIPHLLLFAALFWLAGIAGLEEFDAIAGWALKAKIIHMFRGHDIIRWFSEPRLAFAHLDYPVLVPALHAFTYGVLGSVNEFVTKFWSVWMALGLVAAVLSVSGFPRRRWVLAPALTLVVISMPVTMQHMLGEGATIPSMFFTTLGSIECSLGIVNSDRKRIWVGLFLLLGSALTKFEGFVALGLWLAALLCRSSTRKLVSCGRKEFLLLALGMALILPYAVVKKQIPQLHPDQQAFRTLRNHPMLVASHTPAILATILARQCADERLVAWKRTDQGGVVWTGEWSGLESLVSGYNLGWGWLCIMLSAGLILWRATRPSALVVCAVCLAFLVFIAIIYCALPYNATNLTGIVGMTGNPTGGRHVAPIYVAWGLTLAVLVLSMRSRPAEEGSSQT